MMRRLVLFTLILAVALTTGCSYFQKTEPPPPLPPIEEPKPPLKMKSEYFNSFPWDDLSKPQEGENEPDTWTYTFKTGDTLESVAQKEMGDSSMADRLASYNDLSSPSTVTPGKAIVIPDPILGVSSKIMVKHKGEKQFGTPQPFGVEFKKGDEYKFRFETNVDGYLYVFRRGAKGVAYLYPLRIKPPKKPARGRRGKKPEPPQIMRESAKV